MALPTSVAPVSLLLLITASASLPAATAQPPPLILGTEDEPELWGDDTVAYDPAYPFGRDHDYLAINRSWFAVDPEETRLQTHLRVVSTERLAANRQANEIHCSLDADLPDPSGSNPRPARIVWGFTSAPTSQEIGGYAYVDSGAGATDAAHAIDVTFSMVSGTPGYYIWSVSRATVLRYGWNLVDVSASCYESPAFAFINRDDATSSSNFSVVENRRVAAPDGALDPIERFERENATAAPSSTAPEGGGGGTPAPGSAALFVAVLVVAFAWRRRWRPARHR